MAQENVRLYSVAAGSSNIPKPEASMPNRHEQQGSGNTSTKQTPNPRHSKNTQRHAPSPSYVPRTSSPENSVYVLTLLTSSEHSRTLNSARQKYFPPRLNRLDAHITLFHALPGSELETAIKPKLRLEVSNTAPFHILAATPFRLNKGIAIGIPKSQGGDDARQIHGNLKSAWKGFLSPQDAGGFAAHYTIMNKVDDQKEVQRAFDQVESEWQGCHGTVLGLSLFRYDKGNWVHEEDFKFTADEH